MNVKAVSRGIQKVLSEQKDCYSPEETGRMSLGEVTTPSFPDFTIYTEDKQVVHKVQIQYTGGGCLGHLMLEKSFQS